MRQILCLTMLCLLIAAHVDASTASKIFKSASSSTVMVNAHNAAGKSFAYGTGVVLPDGSIATNCHVLSRAPRLSVRFQDKDYDAERKYTDRDRDLCTITVNGLKAPAVKLGSTRRLKVGARVYAIGTPQGLELTISEGIVSGFREDEVGRYIQTTAPISPGSSGGGLFDKKGRLVGIMSFYITKGQNLNFALPVEWIADLPQRHALFRERDEKLDKCRAFFNRPDKDPFISELERDERFMSWDRQKQTAFIRYWIDKEYAQDERYQSYDPEKKEAFKQWFINKNLPDPAWECW